MLGQLGIQTGHSGVPYYIMAMMAFIKALFGIRFDDNIKYLSSDPHVLRLLGFNLKSIKEGYSKRTKNVDSAKG
jgi:hypothetical protein